MFEGNMINFDDDEEDWLCCLPPMTEEEKKRMNKPLVLSERAGTLSKKIAKAAAKRAATNSATLERSLSLASVPEEDDWDQSSSSSSHAIPASKSVIPTSEPSHEPSKDSSKFSDDGNWLTASPIRLDDPKYMNNLRTRMGYKETPQRVNPPSLLPEMVVSPDIESGTWSRPLTPLSPGSPLPITAASNIHFSSPLIPSNASLTPSEVPLQLSDDEDEFHDAEPEFSPEVMRHIMETSSFDLVERMLADTVLLEKEEDRGCSPSARGSPMLDVDAAGQSCIRSNMTTSLVPVEEEDFSDGRASQSANAASFTPNHKARSSSVSPRLADPFPLADAVTPKLPARINASRPASGPDGQLGSAGTEMVDGTNQTNQSQQYLSARNGLARRSLGAGVRLSVTTSPSSNTVNTRIGRAPRATSTRSPNQLTTLTSNGGGSPNLKPTPSPLTNGINSGRSATTKRVARSMTRSVQLTNPPVLSMVTPRAAVQLQTAISQPPPVSLSQSNSPNAAVFHTPTAAHPQRAASVTPSPSSISAEMAAMNERIRQQEESLRQEVLSQQQHQQAARKHSWQAGEHMSSSSSSSQGNSMASSKSVDIGTLAKHTPVSRIPGPSRLPQPVRSGIPLPTKRIGGASSRCSTPSSAAYSKSGNASEADDECF